MFYVGNKKYVQILKKLLIICLCRKNWQTKEIRENDILCGKIFVIYSWTRCRLRLDWRLEEGLVLMSCSNTEYRGFF